MTKSENTLSSGADGRKEAWSRSSIGALGHCRIIIITAVLIIILQISVCPWLHQADVSTRAHITIVGLFAVAVQLSLFTFAVKESKKKIECVCMKEWGDGGEW